MGSLGDLSISCASPWPCRYLKAVSPLAGFHAGWFLISCCFCVVFSLSFSHPADPLVLPQAGDFRDGSAGASPMSVCERSPGWLTPLISSRRGVQFSKAPMLHQCKSLLNVGFRSLNLTDLNPSRSRLWTLTNPLSRVLDPRPG